MCTYIYYYHRNDVSHARAPSSTDRRRRFVRDLLRRAGKWRFACDQRPGEKSHFEKVKLLSVLAVLPTRTSFCAAQESQEPTVNRVIISGFFFVSFSSASPFYDSSVLPHLIWQCVLMLCYRLYYAGPVIELTETENAFKT